MFSLFIGISESSKFFSFFGFFVLRDSILLLPPSLPSHLGNSAEFIDFYRVIRVSTDSMPVLYLVLVSTRLGQIRLRIGLFVPNFADFLNPSWEEEEEEEVKTADLLAAPMLYSTTMEIFELEPCP